MISAGLFREDLYYRLNGLVVRLPALRDRSDLDVGGCWLGRTADGRDET